MVQLHELELHRPDQVVELVQQPLVDVCVNGQLNTVQFYATTDSEAEVARCHFEAARAARKGGVDPESTACKLDQDDLVALHRRLLPRRGSKALFNQCTC